MIFNRIATLAIFNLGIIGGKAGIGSSLAAKDSNDDCLSMTDYICSSYEYSTLCNVLASDGFMYDDLSSGKWTLFAPTDAAFDAGQSKNIDLVDKIIQFHFIKGKSVSFDELICTERLEMASKKDSRTKCQGKNKYQTGKGNREVGRMPLIVAPDIAVCNGIIHGVDHLLLPSLSSSSSSSSTSSSDNNDNDNDNDNDYNSDIDKDVLFWSTTRQARAIRDGVFTSRELLDLMITQIDAINPMVNAIVTLDLEGARLAADAADAQLAAGAVVGPLHGIPFTVKDNLETEGILSTNGDIERIDYIGKFDAPVVKAMKDAGAILLGKSNTAWNGCCDQTNNAVFGITSNPWDVTRTPGGSSGGAAVAVSTGMSSFEIGTDKGGSIRQPASYCGIFGHKPTYNIVPNKGFVAASGITVYGDEVITDAFDDISSAGPLARSAEDLKMLLDLMMTTAPLSVSLPEPPDDIKSLKVAVWLDETIKSYPVESKVRVVLDTAVTNLENSGVSVDRSARPNFDPLSLEEVYNYGVFLNEPPFNSTYYDWVGNNFNRNAVRSKWAEFFNDYDAIIVPVYPFQPPLHSNEVDTDMDEWGQWTVFVGMSYLPSTVPPIGLTSDGLPVSFQVVGPYGGDYTTIKLAGYIAELNGGYQQPPVS